MRKIKITFPNGFVAHAVVNDAEEPYGSELMWKYLEQPCKAVCQHTVSTGRGYLAVPRPPKNPLEIEKAPAKEGFMLTDAHAGEIYFRNGWNFFVIYGDPTEPLSPSGPLTAKVVPEDLEQYCEACYDVWLHNYTYHKLAYLVFEREEEDS